MALAGPAVNVVIAAVLILVLGATLDERRHDGDGKPARRLIARLAAANIFLVVFNLIPAFPMDGGRVLRALLAMRVGRAEATRIAARIGQGAAFLFALAGLFVNPMLIVIGLFIYLAATAEAQHVAFRDGTQGLPVRDAMITPVESLAPGATLERRRRPDAAHRAEGVPGPRRLRPPARAPDPGRAHRRAAPGRDRRRRCSTAWCAIFRACRPGARSRRGSPPSTRRKRRRCSSSTRPAGSPALLTPENVGEMMLVRSVRPDWRFRRLKGGLSAGALA